MSLRARLLLALGAVALIALVAADVATYSSLQSFLIGHLDQQLETAHMPLEQMAETNPGGPGPGTFPSSSGNTGTSGGLGSAGSQTGIPTSLCSLAQAQAQGVFVQLRTSSGNPTTCDAHDLGGKEVEPRLATTITGFSSSGNPGEPAVYFDAASATAGGPTFRVRASKLTNGDILIVALPLSDVNETLRHLLLIELAVTAGALALAGLVGWWTVRIGLRPLAAIEHTAATIAEGELGHRVPGESTHTEVGRLAGVLNTMLARSEDAFSARDATESRLRASEARMRQFVSDASHELRTPLAAVSAYAELFDRGASSRPEDLGRVMTGIRSETGRMGHLVDDLLLLARIDEGRPLEIAPIELVGLVSEAVDAAGAVGPQWPIEMQASEPIELDGDRSRLRQVVDNLLSNTRAHTPPGTQVKVSVYRDGPDAVCEVSDDGPGIDPDTAPRLFERFYRSDTSRSRASGGSGLGLSIVAAIVAGHGGTVTARPRHGGGSTFTIRIPVSGHSASTVRNGSASSQEPHSLGSHDV